MNEVETVRQALRQFADHAVAMDETFLSVLSGLLMILGYTLYIRRMLADGFHPNPSTWLMFAYGTALLTILEFDRDAQLHLLMTPIACAALSIWIALICWHRNTIQWPDDSEDRIAFILDILLTVAYVSAWAIATYGLVASFTEADREEAALLFLVFSNITTVTAFMPLIRGVFGNPDAEFAPAWVVWAFSYITLGVATYQNEDSIFSELMIYPASNAFLHGLVALLASRPPQQKHV